MACRPKRRDTSTPSKQIIFRENSTEDEGDTDLGTCLEGELNRSIEEMRQKQDMRRKESIFSVASEVSSTVLREANDIFSSSMSSTELLDDMDSLSLNNDSFPNSNISDMELVSLSPTYSDPGFGSAKLFNRHSGGFSEKLPYCDGMIKCDSATGKNFDESSLSDNSQMGSYTGDIFAEAQAIANNMNNGSFSFDSPDRPKLNNNHDVDSNLFELLNDLNDSLLGSPMVLRESPMKFPDGVTTSTGQSLNKNCSSEQKEDILKHVSKNLSFTVKDADNCTNFAMGHPCEELVRKNMENSGQRIEAMETSSIPLNSTFIKEDLVAAMEQPVAARESLPAERTFVGTCMNTTFDFKKNAEDGCTNFDIKSSSKELVKKTGKKNGQGIEVMETSSVPLNSTFDLATALKQPPAAKEPLAAEEPLVSTCKKNSGSSTLLSVMNLSYSTSSSRRSLAGAVPPIVPIMGNSTFIMDLPGALNSTFQVTKDPHNQSHLMDCPPEDLDVVFAAVTPQKPPADVVHGNSVIKDREQSFLRRVSLSQPSAGEPDYAPTSKPLLFNTGHSSNLSRLAAVNQLRRIQTDSCVRVNGPMRVMPQSVNSNGSDVADCSGDSTGVVLFKENGMMKHLSMPSFGSAGSVSSIGSPDPECSSSPDALFRVKSHFGPHITSTPAALAPGFTSIIQLPPSTPILAPTSHFKKGEFHDELQHQEKQIEDGNKMFSIGSPQIPKQKPVDLEELVIPDAGVAGATVSASDMAPAPDEVEIYGKVSCNVFQELELNEEVLDVLVNPIVDEELKTVQCSIINPQVVKSRNVGAKRILINLPTNSVATSSKQELKVGFKPRVSLSGVTVKPTGGAVRSSGVSQRVVSLAADQRNKENISASRTQTLSNVSATSSDAKPSVVKMPNALVMKGTNKRMPGEVAPKISTKKPVAQISAGLTGPKLATLKSVAKSQYSSKLPSARPVAASCPVPCNVPKHVSQLPSTTSESSSMTTAKQRYPSGSFGFKLATSATNKILPPCTFVAGSQSAPLTLSLATPSNPCQSDLPKQSNADPSFPPVASDLPLNVPAATGLVRPSGLQRQSMLSQPGVISGAVRTSRLQQPRPVNMK